MKKDITNFKMIPDGGQFTEEEKISKYEEAVNNIEAVYDYFNERYENGERNFRYYKGQQWTSEELIAHKRQFRRAYVFNEIFSKIDHLMGTQNETRMDINVLPRETNDSKQAELLNNIIKWVEQINDLQVVESTVFFDALVRGFGVSGINWKFEDVMFGYPEIEVYPSWQFFWDLNSIKLDLSDARWMARLQYLSRKTLKELFPEYADEIEEISRSFGKFAYSFPYWLHPENRAQQSGLSNKDYELLPLIEYYDWKLINKYIVYDDIQNKQHSFEDVEEAQAFADGLRDGYTNEGQILWTPAGDPRVFVTIVQEREYQQSLIIGDKIFTINTLATPFFPYDICFVYFHHGEFWSLTDHLISPQDLINRAFSQLDYHLGTSVKGAITVVRSALDKSFTMEDLRQEWSKTSPVIPVLNHDAIRQHMFNNVPPQLFDEVNFGIQRLTDYIGGRNILGFTEKAGESGKAVMERAQQAGLARLPFFDKLKQWKARVGEKIVWYIKNMMEAGQILRIVGNDNSVEFIRLTPELVNSIKELNYDIIVDETAHSQYVKQKYFNQLLSLFQQFPTAPEVIVPTLIEFSELPESKKQLILDRMEIYQQYVAQKQQATHEQNIQQQAEDVVKRKMIRQKMQSQLNVPERSP